MTIQKIKKDIAEGQQMLYTKCDVLRIIEEVAKELSTHNESDPIPLTEETLEKHGFERYKAYRHKAVYNIGKNTIDGCPIYISPCKERGLEVGYTEDGGYADVIFNCVYVDDMIKALRWCGFDELADNLKI